MHHYDKPTEESSHAYFGITFQKNVGRGVKKEDDEIRQKMTSKDINVKSSYLKCQKVGKSGMERNLSKCLSQQLLKKLPFSP